MKTDNETMNYIDKAVKEDLESGRYNEVVTRFPPEPNGCLHIGSAYAINNSYQIAKKYNGTFNLRFDDTNPKKENDTFVESIKEDLKWLGFNYDNVFYGSDYSEQIYHYALYLIKKGKAYVCDLNSDEIREYRGTLTEKGKDSPYRNRSIEENLELFRKMKEGKLKEGEKVLRAKIDMASPNINLRDPIIYRISYTPHYRTGTKWCIYPMYDFAHPLQDYIEGISHSLCSFEFINNRPLYEWVLNELDLTKQLPRQIEFGRVNLTGVVTSKRYLRQLVEMNIVDGWDDPRLPTIQGLRRRGYTKEAIHHFLGEIGLGKTESNVDIAMLEQSLRKILKPKVSRVMTVVDPIKIVITNLPDNYIEYLDADNNKENETLGIRRVPFTKEIYIERDDFSENPPKKYRRLTLENEVRLMLAYFIKCHEVIKDESGKIIELRCTYDPKTKSGTGFKERKPKGTIHWVSATKGIPCEVRIINKLFSDTPSKNNLLDAVNPHSLVIKNNSIMEPSILELNEDQFQFIRDGYYKIDDKLSSDNNIVFNQTVSLKSSYK